MESQQSFTEFYRVLPGFTEFYLVLPCFTGISWAVLVFTQFYPSFTYFCLVLPTVSLFFFNRAFYPSGLVVARFVVLDADCAGLHGDLRPGRLGGQPEPALRPARRPRQQHRHAHGRRIGRRGRSAAALVGRVLFIFDFYPFSFLSVSISEPIKMSSRRKKM